MPRILIDCVEELLTGLVLRDTEQQEEEGETFSWVNGALLEIPGHRNAMPGARLPRGRCCGEGPGACTPNLQQSGG